MTFDEIPDHFVCRPCSVQAGDEFSWHTKSYWLVHAELKWAYWMGEWEVKGVRK